MKLMDSKKVSEILTLSEAKQKTQEDVAKVMAEAKAEAGQIADMANHPGWQVFEGRIKAVIAELLVPLDLDDVGPDASLSTIGSMAIARSAGIDMAEQILTIVATAREEREEDQKNNSKDEEVSE